MHKCINMISLKVIFNNVASISSGVNDILMHEEFLFHSVKKICNII